MMKELVSVRAKSCFQYQLFYLFDVTKVESVRYSTQRFRGEEELFAL